VIFLFAATSAHAANSKYRRFGVYGEMIPGFIDDAAGIPAAGIPNGPDHFMTIDPSG